MIKEAIEKVVSKQDLTYDEAYTRMFDTTNSHEAAWRLIFLHK